MPEEMPEEIRPESRPPARPDSGPAVPREAASPARWGWAAMALLALAAGWEAWGYRVAFVTDAAGPRALPLLAAGLLLGGALTLSFRPMVAARGGANQTAALVRPTAAATLLLAIPFLLPWLGFMVTTGGAMAGLAMLLGGRPSRALIAGAVTAAVLYLLFVYGLGVPLPVGSLFLASASGGS